ncbi:STAS domain-containing protein [Kitasatospora sp. NA04385]|uniref:STAS domain-containing protein n=1 Tax=Kitasatospora sp. NA04385 TaxID=2742135 RepID=UPI0015916A9C|nr:STAS domain-containing protein [Kitasatospora sp. NA04385]QKW17864.1 STAS domain-containing protein [Kitasatospora sp. NA04385]
MIVCTGELDVHTAPHLDRQLGWALAIRPAPAILLVDLQEVSFMDSTGLNSLLTARREADRHGVLLALAHPGPQVTRLLELTGTAALFPLSPRPPRPQHPD